MREKKNQQKKPFFLQSSYQKKLVSSLRIGSTSPSSFRPRPRTLWLIFETFIVYPPPHSSRSGLYHVTFLGNCHWSRASLSNNHWSCHHFVLLMEAISLKYTERERERERETHVRIQMCTFPECYPRTYKGRHEKKIEKSKIRTNSHIHARKDAYYTKKKL